MEKRVPKVQTVGHYRIVKQIGAGGMGVVFDAEDLKLGRHVALKFLPVSDTLDAHALDRFRREARTASALNHPNICTIYEIDEVEGQPLIAMELLEGQTLHSRLSESPLPIETACDIAIQIAAGLQAAHSKNIIHRDIKPANIFVTSYGTVKILDFGLAKLSHADDLDTNDATSSLTRTGTTLGTIAYMSPEQVAGEPLDCRSDLFSFGVVLYQMFSGRLPFSGATSGVVFDAILNREPLPLSDANPQVPPALANIVRKSLEKDRERRYQTASEIAGDLNQVRLEAQATGTAPFSPQAIRLNLDRNERKQEGFVPHRAGNRDIDRSSTTRSPRRNLLISALALLLIATLASGGWAVWRYRHPSQKSAPPSKNTIVLADFSNTTGDDVFAGTLKQALAADLDQTPFFNILSSEQVKEQLRLMGRKEDERMSADIAREVCLRAGGKAVLVGAISSLGAHYLVALNAIGCSDGDTLVRAQSEADARESVLNALQQVTTTVRKQLGESLESIKQYDIPLDRVTTPSLDALRMFTLGDQATDVGDEAGAIPFYQRAIALDPNFATA